MATHDPLPDRDTNLVAAAQAAASWARARRATWTDEALKPVAAPPAVSVPKSEPEPERIPEPELELKPEPSRAPARLPAPAAIPPSRSQPSAAGVAKAWRSVGPRVVRWLAWGAASVVLAFAAALGVRYVMRVAPTLLTRPSIVESTETGPPASSLKTTGTLNVKSTPTGAKVIVDAEPRGATPLTLGDLSPGRHEVVVESDAGTVRRTVTIAANQTEEIDVSIFSGFLIVYAPFDVEVVEGGRVLQPDERNQIMLRPGTHELRVVNRTLAYETVRNVEVRPGETTTVRLTPPSSTLTVIASEAAEVWLDGVRVGETPLNALPIALGTHEVVVRRGAGGERRFTVTIGVKPFTLNAAFG